MIGNFLERFRFECALSYSAADTPIRASSLKVLERNVTYAVAEAELGAVQSKATKLVVLTVQVRSRTHATFQGW